MAETKKKVLITGATGFIGSALAEDLCPEYEVVGLSRNAQKASKKLAGGVRSVQWDGRTSEGWGEEAESRIRRPRPSTPSRWAFGGTLEPSERLSFSKLALSILATPFPSMVLATTDRRISLTIIDPKGHNSAGRKIFPRLSLA